MLLFPRQHLCPYLTHIYVCGLLVWTWCVIEEGSAVVPGSRCLSLRPTWTVDAFAILIGAQPPQVGVWICSVPYRVPGFHVPQVTKSKQRAIITSLIILTGNRFPDVSPARNGWLHLAGLTLPSFPFVMLALVLPSCGSCIKFSEGWCNKVPHAWVPPHNRNLLSHISGKGKLYIWVIAGSYCSPRGQSADMISPLSLCVCVSLSISVPVSLSLALSPFWEGSRLVTQAGL